MPDVGRVPPFDRPASYDDLLKLPPNLVAEIVEGELQASARPPVPHARLAARLGSRIIPPFDDARGGPGGWVFLYEPGLHLQTDIFVPDLAAWRRARLPVVPDAAFLTVEPDWVCEILSPSTEAFDRVKKLAGYARHAVGHAWLLDPAVRTLEVLRLEGGRSVIVLTAEGEELVRAEPFAEIEMPLGAFWP